MPAFNTGHFFWSKDKTKTHAGTYSDDAAAADDAFALVKTDGHEAAIAGFDVLTIDACGDSRIFGCYGWLRKRRY